ncbi:MAG TPA: GNAT family N-acetyltransferase [Phycisphaerae bacterium]|nr:GNAT family N-acetyltransferase [Phycisphaerae bacterium]HNU46464.1 GNAT family N-acetyltransferase [Phycisphaerae bacterium]
MWQDAYPKQVMLKDGRNCTIRLLQPSDFDKLTTFFGALPDEDRVFFRHNVQDPNLLRKWTTAIDLDRVVPLVAETDGELVATGTLHLARLGWLRHVAHLRVAVARKWRRVGLAGLLTRELVRVARERHLEKVLVEVIRDNRPLIAMLERLGFATAAVMNGLAKDIRGQARDLVIMVDSISDLSRVLEDWIADSMIPAYRVPGGGY